MRSTIYVHRNISFGQAVDLIPFQTGNVTLEKGLPIFYDCIVEKINESKGVAVDPYFEKERTKNEVTTCYNEVFFDNSHVESSNDSSELSDIEKFNSLFGFTSWIKEIDYR